MARKTKNSRGFSLIEILIGIAILGVLLTAIYSLFMSANKSQISQDLEVEMQQNGRSALDFMVRELKSMNAINCLENTTTSCSGTTGDKIVFTSVTDPTDTRVFSWSSSDKILRFSKAPSGSEDRQPLADNITAISLTPFDANNNITTAIGNVRRIDITVTARTSRIDPNTKDYRSYSVKSSVTKRN